MLQFTTLSVFLCVMGLLSETLSSPNLEAEAGDNVTIWCQHDLTETSFIFWFKQTSDSVPLLLGCKRFRTSAPSETCYFFSESERIVMSVHGSKTSLTITAVNVSDTGLYYCSFTQLEQVRFRNSTNLQVKGSVSPAVFFMLIVVFGAVIVFLLTVLIFIILKHRKTVSDSDSVNYAALQFSKKKTKRDKRHDFEVGRWIRDHGGSCMLLMRPVADGKRFLSCWTTVFAGGESIEKIAPGCEVAAVYQVVMEEHPLEVLAKDDGGGRRQKWKESTVSDSDSLQFSKKKTKRNKIYDVNVYTHVVYSSVGQRNV
ncbi:uncharacterized protein LOC131343767 [Hemibagrus wyckioides]|uniref:uncharacterized protein LOC131343767 n=1 Tax=Hemibagrus wyckioides TaxID=337641 RepID=UPI00266DA14A|nr:uncharacterized protein LOC131343767 [Hemibagrus wyckioides]